MRVALSEHLPTLLLKVPLSATMSGMFVRLRLKLRLRCLESSTDSSHLPVPLLGLGLCLTESEITHIPPPLLTLRLLPGRPHSLSSTVDL